MTVENCICNDQEVSTVDDIRQILLRDKGFKNIFIFEGNFEEKNNNKSLFFIINELTSKKGVDKDGK